MIEIELSNSIEAKKYLDNNKSSFMKLLVNSVEYSFLNNLKSVIVAKIYLTEEDISMNIEIGEANWKKTLNLALSHYTKMEEYEECINVNNLLKQIKSC